ncbi:Hypothetical_protein [Hexamita inflata]|uniref:Hypothetical_protein n=1 Tax=Hexamita inflata TaxID=28002 RepID=A0AA86P8X6_9EUKA|nr:Hypothetical protein HINF_LOCUS20798 [Hexamita inflata]
MQSLADYLNVSAFEAENHLQTLLFQNQDQIQELVKRYIILKIFSAKQHHCYFKQKKNSTVIVTLKNNICKRACGRPTAISYSSIFKNWGIYEKQLKYIATNLNDPLILFDKQTIKTLFSKEQKFYFVRFSGEHSFDSLNPCDLTKIKMKRFCSKEENEQILIYCSVLENQQFLW